MADDDEFSLQSLPKSLDSNAYSTPGNNKVSSRLTSQNVEPENNLLVSQRAAEDFSSSNERT